MSEPDWDSGSEEFASDQLAALDELRGRCPVAHGVNGRWSLFRHRDVTAAALDPETFPSGASRYRSVPNGMNGEEHARYRAIVDRYLEPAVVRRLEPGFREIAAGLMATVPADGHTDAVNDLGARFAVRAQSAWLGWPAELEPALLGWMEKNRRASRSRNQQENARVAAEFDAIITSLIEARRQAGEDAPDDVTTALMRERVDGRPLTEPDLVSMLRNWTAGDLGSIAACFGVVVHRLAIDRELQDEWRAGPGREVLDRGIDEALRIDNPFTFNRRVTAREVELGGRTIPAGEQVMLNWTAACRDPEVFGDPDEFRPEVNAAGNLVYGIGEHVCPGRELSTIELRVAVEELLAATERFELDPESPPTRERWPYGGYRTVPIRISR